MPEQKLSTLYVEFAQKGLEPLRAAITAINSSLDQVGRLATQGGNQADQSFTGLNQVIANVARAIGEFTSSLKAGFASVPGAAALAEEGIGGIGIGMEEASQDVAAASAQIAAALAKVQERLGLLKPPPLNISVVVQGFEEAQKKLTSLKGADVPVAVKAQGLDQVEQQLQKLKPEV